MSTRGVRRAVLLAAGLPFAGNFLFEFALYPDAPFTMSDLFERGNVTGIGDGPEMDEAPDRKEWREYSAAAQEWLRTEGEAVELQRPDVLAWIDTIIQRDPEARIVLHGVSMGGATVMMASGEDLPDNVKCIVEDCGYSSVWDEFSFQLKNVFHLPAFPILNAASMFSKLRAGYSFQEASSVEQLKKATVPMLFIHGDADTFVPFEMLDVVYNACASAEKEKLVSPGAAHGGAVSTEPTLYWDTVTAFLDKYAD